MTKRNDLFSRRLASAQGATHALIDLDALAGNVAAIKRILPAQTELISVIKGNAYGHGAIPLARAALAAGASQLAVARIEEGLVLRAAGLTAPILVLGPPNEALLAEAIAADLSLTSGSFRLCTALSEAAASVARPARVHLKIDTGMYRYGLLGEEAVALAQRIVNDSHLTFEGFFSHFATADEEDDEFTREQIDRFQVAWTALIDAGLEPRYVHLANSAGTLRGAFPVVEGKRTLARVGLALYGLSPSSVVPVTDDFRPVMTFKSRLAHLFTLPAGAGVSYGLTYRSPSAVRCATLPVGYADGFSRHLSNNGWVLVRGVACPIRGRVCMDQTIVEVEAAGDVAEGDEAILIGDGSDGAMTADQIAEICGTINYEVIAALSARVPRIYVRDGRPVAVSDLRGLVELDDPDKI